MQCQRNPKKLHKVQENVLKFALCYCKDHDWKVNSAIMVRLINFVIPDICMLSGEMKKAYDCRSYTGISNEGKIEIEYHGSSSNWALVIDVNRKRVELYNTKYVLGKRVK